MKKGVLLTIVLVLVLATNALGQKKERKDIVSGYVTDMNSNPVAGAMILIDRLNTEVYTNKKGFYKVRIIPGARMIGAHSEKSGSAESPLDGRQEINIILCGEFAFQVLEPEVHDDKLINIGYGKERRENLSTSPGHINAKQYKYASYTNIYEMIRGEVPGVQVNGNQIIIRGINSINLSSDPLFVVDGVVVSSIDNITPSEVKSISVLKGPDAAIYGTRAANGVILIDMKGAGDK